METYLVTITYIDFTDVPPARSVAEKFQIELTPDQAKKYKQRLTRLFNKHSDGNDCAYDLSMVKVNDVELWTERDLTAWIDDFRTRV